MTKRKYTDEQRAMFILQLETLGYPNNERALLEVSRPAGAPKKQTLKAWWVRRNAVGVSDIVTPKKEAPTASDIQPLLAQFNGNISAVARHLGYKSRGRLYRLIDESEELQEARDDSRETFVDDVESALFNNALDGNVAAQIFIMKAHPTAKKRGWGERQEIGGKDGGPLAIDYTHHLEGVSDDELQRRINILARGALGGIAADGGEMDGDSEPFTDEDSEG